jgi:hypothetical protein
LASKRKGQWNSIFLILDEIDFDIELVNLINHLFEMSDNIVDESYLYALKILTKLVPDHPTLLTTHFMNLLLFSFFQFKGCSDFHVQFIEFIRTALEHKSAQFDLIHIFLPAILNQLHLSEISLLTSSCFQLLDMFDVCVQRNEELFPYIEKIPEYIVFVQVVLKRRDEILKSEYGYPPKTVLSRFQSLFEEKPRLKKRYVQKNPYISTFDIISRK